MCTTSIAQLRLIALFSIIVVTGPSEQLTNSNPSAPNIAQRISETEVSVFFGETGVLSLGDLQTNALAAVRARGHQLSEISKCAVNITVEGKYAGCAVILWDLKTKVTYQVIFDVRGKVASVSGGPMRHGGAPRWDAPRPQVPTGGVVPLPAEPLRKGD